MSNAQPTSVETITLPKSVYFHQMFLCDQEMDKVYCPYNMGTYIKQVIDPTEVYCHIEMPQDNIPILQGFYEHIKLDPIVDIGKRCIAWSKRAWQQANERHVALKLRSEDNRRKSIFESKQIEYVAYGYMRLGGYSFEEALPLARSTYLKKDTSFIQLVLGYKEVAYYESKIEFKKGNLNQIQ